MALGAHRVDVVRLVVRQTMWAARYNQVMRMRHVWLAGGALLASSLGLAAQPAKSAAASMVVYKSAT